MQAYTMMKATHTRPSTLMGIYGLVAYAVDRAVVHFGTSYEAAIHEATAGAKTREAAEKAAARVTRRWLPSAREYSDPSRR